MPALKNDRHSAIRTNAVLLASYADELQRRLATQGESLPPEDALCLLRQITQIFELMSLTCEAAKVNSLQ